MRMTAGGWRIAMVFAMAVGVAPAWAAPPSRVGRPDAPAAAAVAHDGGAEARRRAEIDALERQDIADALKRRFDISVDWRTTSRERLIDMRVRAAKAAELQERLGVIVDWQRYSWIELEALRRTLMSFDRDHTERGAVERGVGQRDPAGEDASSAPSPLPPSDDGLVRPTFSGGSVANTRRRSDPDGVLMPTFGRPPPRIDARDPDGIMRPTFTARPRWTLAGADPDGLMPPSFTHWRPPAGTGEGDDLIDPTRP